jgi:hypothetical protein
MKTMKRLLFIMFAAATIMFAGCEKNDDENDPANVVGPFDAPSLAASTQIWTFDDQTWSDVIHCPECNKETFEYSFTEPQCRSYTEEGKTWYYYNWKYVNANKNTLCPSPWRVPTESDFSTLISDTTITYSTLIDAWGYGGYALGTSLFEVDTDAFYWSSTANGTNYAYNLGLDRSGNLDLASGNHKYYGFQVRCVKDN